MQNEFQSEPQRKRLQISGVVQGVGFRPFVWKRAVGLDLTGWVRNDSAGVVIELQGTESQLDKFLSGFLDSIPTLASIDSLVVTEVDALVATRFEILESAFSEISSTLISPDITVCDACLRELQDPQDRRYLYPFINCTHCGPRFTIVEDIPYDRPLTTMRSFPMCEDCRREYKDPADRRFHAQPNACPVCGPTIWFVTNKSDEQSFHAHPDRQLGIAATIREFHAAIERGTIVAVKGIGGFHLACDATNHVALAELRKRKGRVDKPFAVMVRDVEQAERFADVSNQERRLLESKARPIVLLRRRKPIASAGNEPHALVAPGNDFVGVMLPFSPLHYQLVNEKPLVFTSANIAEEPIVRTNAEAIVRLVDLADRFLLHDRDIYVACDDSVVRCIENELLPIRRSRGYAPMPVRLPGSGTTVLAVGGELKSTFCLAHQEYAYLSQHVGDMGNLETLNALRRSVDHFLKLFRAAPKAVVADLHPRYLSGQWANDFAKSIGVPLVRVQHHFAHVAALIAEHQLDPDQRLIGCCFDGTGYGTDDAIWGGEFMLADAHQYQRMAHLAYTPLPGGDISVRRPYRTALAHLWAFGLPWDKALPCVAACPTAERKLLEQQLQQSLNCIRSSSMGRLFDVVASLIGVRHQISYEAQAAIELESLAATGSEACDAAAYSFNVGGGPLSTIDHAGLLEQICSDVQSGLEPRLIAAQFHHAVANMVGEVCQRLRERVGINSVGLTGGVFQNVLLLSLTTKRLGDLGFHVITHRLVPPNDGGLALGQALVARHSV